MATAKQTHTSFAEGVHEIVQLLAMMELAPDANPDFIKQVRDLTVSMWKQANTQGPGGQPPMGAAPAGPPGGMDMGLGVPPLPQGPAGGGPLPVAPVGEGGLSRGPRPNPAQPSPGELQRILQGS